MFKKVLALALVIVMAFSVCVSFASCANGKEEDTTAASNGETTGTDNGTENGTKADEVSANISKVKLGVILLHDENSTYDLNFINGVEEAKKALGMTDDQVILKRNIPESEKCAEAARDLVDEGCNVIFADSFGHESFLLTVAKEFPDVQFCHATGTTAHTENQDNFHNAFASIYEGRYLAGVAAGMKLNELKKEGKLKGEVPTMGYVGAYTYAEVISGYTSFYLGAKSVCEDVVMKVMFTGSWYNETEEKNAAEALIAAGCDLISQHADSMGAPAACESAGIPNVSYNGSTEKACPNTFIVSSRINWGTYFRYICNAVADGKPIAKDFVGTIADDAVVLTEIGGIAPAAGTAEKLAEVKAQLCATENKLHVFDVTKFTVTVGDGKNGNAKVDADGHLTSYMADVDTDAEFKGDTEVVENGYFHESEKRSAPYFDVQIDGITLLNAKY